ncbi:hypothetical protein [Actinoplanes solisilvae]|uniref:MmyB family transcriptional regulator n=1 Tax=Actinoplanes solisilvae TaxID=2486853 RepID=UPI0013E29EE0|nr:hypothetical protein [Actinoplanes solisilvae]
MTGTRGRARRSRPASKTLNLPKVGTCTWQFQIMQIEGTAGHSLVTFLAEPGTPDHRAMVVLDRTSP